MLPYNNDFKALIIIQQIDFPQFCNGKFKEAMDVFYKLDIDPSHVIGLYSDLLPSEFINQVCTLLVIFDRV